MSTPADEERVSLGESLDALTSLAEPTRRAMYGYVASVGGWVGRDQAAAALGLERGTAAHHLDRLATDGLLEVAFRRLSERRGPGAGRTAKLYRRSGRTFELSLPQRDYELVGRLLAAAAEASKARRIDVDVALDEVSREEGRRIGGCLRLAPACGASVQARVLDVLAEHGYEPSAAEDGTVVLRNCPFHQLAQEHTELVCGMNLSLLDALCATVEASSFVARLEPSESACCVRLHPAGS
jgi:predicted ArsR family transcriptional regulator